MSECHKHLQDIADFIDGELDESLCRELQEHLRECQNCRLMVDTLRQTVIICKDGQCQDLPPSIAAKLDSALKKRWEKKFGKPK